MYKEYYEDTRPFPEIPEDIPYVRAQYFDVLAEDWQWDAKIGRWSATLSCDGVIDADLLEYGSITGNYVIKDSENDIEMIQAALPYLQTLEEPNGTKYTLIIGYEISAEYPYDVTFFLQTTDFSNAEYHLDDYRFKLGYTWDKK